MFVQMNAVFYNKVLNYEQFYENVYKKYKNENILTNRINFDKNNKNISKMFTK